MKLKNLKKIELRKKFKYIFLFCAISISVFAGRATTNTNGIGKLDITADIYGLGGTKIQKMGDKAILDTGVYNSNSHDINNQIIATVSVLMVPKANGNYDSSKDACVIDDEFNGVLDLSKLEGAVNGKEIQLKSKEYNGQGATMTLRTTNFNLDRKRTVILEKVLDPDNPNASNPTYDQTAVFSAYPDKCADDGMTNILVSLAYTFELELSLTNIEGGDIIGGTVELKGEAGKGAIKDIITQQILEIQQGSR